MPAWLEKFFELWQIPDVIITVVTTVFAIAAWWKARSVERQLSGLPRNLYPYDENHDAALVVDLSDQKNPIGMITRIQASLREDDMLKELIEKIDNAEPLQDYEKIPTSSEGTRFSLNYYTTQSSQPGSPKKGRYVTLICSKPMENNSKDASQFASDLYGFLKVLNNSLQKRSVTRLHIFYNGPIPLCTLIGTAFANSFDLRLYHHYKGRYIFLSDGKPQQVPKKENCPNT